MKKVTIDGNGACAHIAYMMNDLAIIYPITPSSTMSELCDSMSANNTPNIFGNKLQVYQMQSEAGVAGALHGALSTGSLTTTFTSSQGLLLMIPNMYKIAGELLPTVFYVAARSLATHALNIFCDYSDIYACLKTGFNIINCSSVQEVNDLAIACNLSALKSQTPFICFFDGFRTSHELNTIEQSTLEEVKSIIDWEDIKRFKSSGMSNNNPYAKGTNQNPDVFFQNRVAGLKYYQNISEIVKESFKKVETITHRSYDTVEYYGDLNAQDVIVSMGSSVDSLIIAQKNLKKTGVIKVRLLKPFDEKTFINKLPKTVKNITVMERNLDVNGTDTLYNSVVNALFKNKIKAKVYTGIFGLGGKEFTPDMAIACFENMRGRKKEYFTVGIYDNVTNTSIEVKEKYQETDTDFACRIYGYGSDGSVSSAKNIIKILSDKNGSYAQGYFDYDSKKSGSLTVSHIRCGKNAINKPFNPQNVNLVMCNHPSFITKFDMTSALKNNGTIIINCEYSAKDLDEIMPYNMKKDIIQKNINVYTIDAHKIAQKFNLAGKINTIMQTALLKLHTTLPYKLAIEKAKKLVVASYSKKGDEVVNRNLNAIDAVKDNLIKLKTSDFTLKELSSSRILGSEYHEDIIKPINNQLGNEIPVSKFSPNGQMPTGTSKLEKRGIANEIPEWIPENCIQCGKCAMSCPHACLKAVEFEELKNSPKSFKTAKAFTSDNRYRMQVSPLDCTGCGVCSEVCPVKNKALVMNSSLKHRDNETENYEFSKTIEPKNPDKTLSYKGLQYTPSYFEFSGACAGCGETPYLKLLTQLYGDRLLIANATGCSSIYGGTFPICPYSKDKEGFGPAWANSLFEDNAEFGFGMAISRKNQRENFIKTLTKNKNKFSPIIKEIVDKFLTDTNNHSQTKELVNRLNFYKCTHIINPCDNIVFDNLQLFINPSTWIIGGDGWAYDIGFGGLDHVVASGENVNILVLDTEVYSNTGGQTSKATPRGASAKFNVAGKTTMKKDLLAMLMPYKNVFLAQVSMGANPDQCIKAFTEAESFNGPSVIVAYAPCVNQGFDMRYSATHQLSAVRSGYTSLYRYNPNVEPSLQMDSFEPTMDYQEFVESENRFKILSKTNPENKERLLNLSEQDAKSKLENLKKQENK